MKRLVTRAALLLAVSATAHPSFAANYYFDASASGGNGSATNPWGSLSAVNALDLNPGDHVYLKGAFNAPSGGIKLDTNDAGSKSNPLIITNWGDSRATINAGNSYGIAASNVGGVSISNLNINGSGPAQRASNGNYKNDSDGIRFYTHESKQNFVRIDNVNVSGFGENGINLRGGNGSAGFNDVKITNSNLSQNQRAGLNIYADHDNANRSAHSNVVIDGVKAFDNPGRATSKNEGHSGNGIVIGQVNGGVIQNSIAYGNGAADASHEGGSVGIWAWDSNNIKIQHNESYKNGTAGHHDGGGFDLDGGVTNSVMQFNYSHDNAGAGYLLAQYKDAADFSGNLVANNISHDDGRKNGYGAIHAFGEIDDTTVKGNVVFISPAEEGLANTRGESPAAIKLRGGQDKEIDFLDNLLIVQTDGDDNSLQPTFFANMSDADGYTLDGNVERLLKAGASEESIAAIEELLEQLGDQLSAGKTVALDVNAFDKYLKANEPVNPTKPIVDVSDDVEEEINNPVKPVAPAPDDEVSGPGAVVPEPSAVAMLAIAGVGLLRRRRR